MRVVNDLLQASDDICVSIFSLLDLSAAFDIVDYSILTARLRTTFGCSGMVLDWFISDSSCRTKSVFVGDESTQSVLKCGVRDRETNRQRHIETERQRDRDRQIDRETETKRQRDKETERQRDRETETETETDRHTDRQAGRLAGRQTDRQTDRDRETDIQQKDRQTVT